MKYFIETFINAINGDLISISLLCLRVSKITTTTTTRGEYLQYLKFSQNTLILSQKDVENWNETKTIVIVTIVTVAIWMKFYGNEMKMKILNVSNSIKKECSQSICLQEFEYNLDISNNHWKHGKKFINNKKLYHYQFFVILNF